MSVYKPESIIYFRRATMPRIREVRSTDNKGKVHYQQKYRGGQWWYVELHLKHFGLFGPAAIGVVLERRDGKVEFPTLQTSSELMGKGYATQIVKAIGERWPSAVWCDTADSRGFHETLVAKGIAQMDPDTLGWDSRHYRFAPSA